MCHEACVVVWGSRLSSRVSAIECHSNLSHVYAWLYILWGKPLTNVFPFRRSLHDSGPPRLPHRRGARRGGWIGVETYQDITQSPKRVYKAKKTLHKDVKYHTVLKEQITVHKVDKADISQMGFECHSRYRSNANKYIGQTCCKTKRN